MPVDIQFGNKTESIDSPTGERDDKGELKKESVEVENIINNREPAWTKKPVGLERKRITTISTGNFTR